MDEPRVVVVLSPKGGAGKTTVATHLAVALANRTASTTALVDLDLAFGDVAASLLLAPRRDLTHAALARRAGDEEAFRKALTEHPSGLLVLAAPEHVVLDPNLLADDAGLVLDALAERCNAVVCDTGAGLDAVTIAAVRRATDVVLVASLDVPTLLSLRKALRWLDASRQLGARRHVVLNRGHEDAGLTLDDVSATIGADVDVVVPPDLEVLRATNDGRPLTSGPVGEAFARLADLVVPPTVDRSTWLDFCRDRLTVAL